MKNMVRTSLWIFFKAPWLLAVIPMAVVLGFAVEINYSQAHMPYSCCGSAPGVSLKQALATYHIVLPPDAESLTYYVDAGRDSALYVTFTLPSTGSLENFLNAMKVDRTSVDGGYRPTSLLWYPPNLGWHLDAHKDKLMNYFPPVDKSDPYSPETSIIVCSNSAKPVVYITSLT